MFSVVHESCSADYTTRIHYAQRQDRQWFVRYQERHPRFGYRFTAWRMTPSVPATAWNTGRTARLPQSR